MSFKDVGKVSSTSEFEKNLIKIAPPSWCKAICLHHTAAPSLIQRPKGFTAQHIINMRDFYQAKGWKSGPHLYADDDQLWHMSPITEKGVHAVSFNSMSIGIEVLGDYDREDPFSGRGEECWKVAAAATKSLLKWLNLEANEKTVLFHRDDPKTSKSCPGNKIKKDWFIKLVNDGVHGSIKESHLPEPIEYQPVFEYVVANKGYTDKEAARLIKKKGNMFFFGDNWIEGARYNAVQSYTEAPTSELAQIKHK